VVSRAGSEERWRQRAAANNQQAANMRAGDGQDQPSKAAVKRICSGSYTAALPAHLCLVT
jgi:hypothetical protein